MRTAATSLVALGVLVAGRASADGELREAVIAHNLELQLKVPSSVVYDSARLGRVVLPVRVTITNRGAAPVPLDPKGLKLSARSALASYPCDAHVPSERWPEALGPGETFASDRVAVCETTLPGRYDVELRWAGATDSDAPAAVSAFTLDPGPLPPVRLSTRHELVASVTGTREVRPSNEPGKVRIVLAVVNTGPVSTTLSPLVIDTKLRQRGKTFFCHDRRTVQLTGVLGPGKLHVVWMPLSCAVPYEGDWDTTVEVGEPKTPMVRLQPLVVHVEEVPDMMRPAPVLPSPAPTTPTPR